MDEVVLELLLAMGDCHRLLVEHAKELKARHHVKEVTHCTDMYRIEDAFRLEEFVDAEHRDGQATSWRLEVTFSSFGIQVEADVRAAHSLGQDLLTEVSDCNYATVRECSADLLQITQRLCSANS